MALPRQRLVIAAEARGKLQIRQDGLDHPLDDDEVLVKTVAVAINPHDAKLLDYSFVPDAVVGGDFAGLVVALGAGAEAEGKFAVGDRVAGVVVGMNPRRPYVGAFAEYVHATADFLLRLPDDMSFEDAATIPLGAGTALYAIRELGVPTILDQLKKAGAPRCDGDIVLVSGGSTATGTRAIQLLKLAGFRPIATCSRKNFELARRFGAEEIFDYHDPDCASKIRAYTEDELELALDCISHADTTQLCYSALGRAGGRYVALEKFRESVAQTRRSVQASWIMAPALLGEGVDLHGEYARDARPEERKFGAAAFATMQRLLVDGLVDTHPIKSMPGSWEGVIQGVTSIQVEPPSAYKLVYSVGGH